MEKVSGNADMVSISDTLYTNSEALRLALIYRRIAQLERDSAHSLNGEKEIRQSAQSIELLDFLVPIIIDERRLVLAQRLEMLAAAQSGKGARLSRWSKQKESDKKAPPTTVPFFMFQRVFSGETYGIPASGLFYER